MTVALWCLFAAAIFHPLSKFPLAAAQAREGKGYDNRNPREQQARLSGWGARARAVHANQIESFPLFAAGVLVATVAAPKVAAIDTLALAYIVARLVYPVLYLKDIHVGRSLVWGVGYIASLALLSSPAWA
ncbi:MAPEG family protein [Nannocystis sp. SCPEA4]|uniref:MAPEG family protein n=1 Tax=Nannocystis sp. SCPEA4 TaxID=2996787 RepID=UPI002270A3B8|nr:MAPEG family protein [Nannocystis sp. SCPEA4]MCY1055553.1 MAPEG family protein [Nannocystis sp. SCPEA4]